MGGGNLALAVVTATYSQLQYDPAPQPASSTAKQAISKDTGCSLGPHQPP